MSPKAVLGRVRSLTSVVFDFDDTLVVSRTHRANVLLEALDDFGVPVHPERLSEGWGRPFHELVALVAPAAVARFGEFVWFYAEMLRRHPPEPCLGVLEAIPALASHHRLFVLSASESLLVRTDLESLGILAAFEFVCGSDWQPHPKPSARSIEPILGLPGLTSGSDWWYVGDSPSDATLAKGAGIRFVGVAWTEERARAFDNVGVDRRYVITSMAQLSTILDAKVRGAGRR